MARRMLTMPLLAAAWFATPTHAAVEVFTDHQQFLGRLTQLGLDDTVQVVNFDTETGQTPIVSGDTLGGFTFSYDLGDPLVELMVTDAFTNPSPYNSLGTNDGDLLQAGDAFDMQFLPVFAIGANFATRDPMLDGDIVLTAAGTSVDLLEASAGGPLADGSDVYFLGLISDTFFKDASLSYGPGVTGQFLFNVDDITTANAACGLDQTVMANTWYLISPPCQPAAPGTVQSEFGDDLPLADYGTRWIVYARNGATNQYVALGLSSALTQGSGYWLKTLDGGVIDIAGDFTPLVIGGLCPSATGCYAIPLATPAVGEGSRYTMAGHPLGYPVAWSDVRVVVDNIAYTPSEANAANLVDKNFYVWNGNGYDSYDDNTPAMTGSLQVYRGFWVRVFEGSIGLNPTLLIPAVP